MKEIWKSIEFVCGEYQVSNFGRVRNTNHRGSGKTRMRTLTLGNNGYLYVGFDVKGRLKNYLVHRLVAMVFIPNPENKPEVNHIDGDRTNNKVSNLEWVTRSENLIHRSNVLMAKTNDRFELQKVKCVETGEVFTSVSAAARAFGTKQSQVSASARHAKYRKTAGGVHWELV